ncbi:MAG: TldD/PmbA family protein [Deltaproteobacteria bacterium]|nr:TldD/PmbA family protein [Deltaproteobacteria bacterium]
MFNHPFALEVAYSAVEESIRLGASYADARYELSQAEKLTVRDGRLDAVVHQTERGLGVRVVVRGAWGFAAVSEPTRHDVVVAARRAVDMARAAAVLLERPVRFVPASPVRSTYRTAIRRDPLAVALEDKIELLSKVDDGLRRHEGVVDAVASVRAQRRRKIYVNSDGAEIDQELVWAGGGCSAGVRGGETAPRFAVRGHPRARAGAFSASGWEFVQGLRLDEQAERVAREAKALAACQPCPAGRMPVLFTAQATADLVSATCGRFLESDRAVGWSHADRFTSSVTGERLGRAQIASPIVNVFADAMAEGGAGTFGFDDEGIEAHRVELIREGRLVGYLVGREAAAALGVSEASGAMRAASWADFPTVTPTNIGLSAGDGGDLESLVADTRAGLLIEGAQDISLDERGELFCGVGEFGWVIENGRRAYRIARPAYRGSTADLWAGCDAIGDAGSWAWFGVLGRTALGRSRPAECIPQGRGAAPARFKALEVGPAAGERRPLEPREGGASAVTYVERALETDADLEPSDLEVDQAALLSTAGPKRVSTTKAQATAKQPTAKRAEAKSEPKPKSPKPKPKRKTGQKATRKRSGRKARG